MQPPKPMPSKNWWKLRAPTRGLMVDGLTDAPKDTPMITECTKIPNSKTCMVTNLHGYLKRDCLVLENIYLVGQCAEKLFLKRIIGEEMFVSKHRLLRPIILVFISVIHVPDFSLCVIREGVERDDKLILEDYLTCHCAFWFH